MNAVLDLPMQLDCWQTFLAERVPSRRHEGWKYADLSFLHTKQYVAASAVVTAATQAMIAEYKASAKAIWLVCVNGFFMAELSDLQHLPSGMIIKDVQTAKSEHAALVQACLSESIDAKKYPFAALNLAMTSNGIFIYQPKQCQLALPIHILSISDADDFISHPLHLIHLENELTLIEEYVASNNNDYFVNTSMYILLGENAALKHYKIQHESLQATHIAHTFVQQKQDSRYALTNITKGAKFSRDEVVAALNGHGANCATSGFYALQQDHQYIDHHIDIQHLAPYTNSEMLYKGVADKKSRAVFNGRVYVQEGAQKITAYQANHHLLLSNQAEVYAKPELEIYADDVKCKHGATTGQIDQDALFYLRARGIDYQTALSILLEGFAEEIITRIEQPDLRARIRELL